MQVLKEDQMVKIAPPFFCPKCGERLVIADFARKEPHRQNRVVGYRLIYHPYVTGQPL
jgi:hypothetical protein